MALDPKIKAICFDAFGTLVEIKDKRRSHAALIGHLSPEAQEQLRYDIMRKPLTIQDCVDTYAPQLDIALIQNLEEDLAAELASITLRPNIDTLWNALRAGGYKIALCSNLALSYGPPLLKKLPGQPDALILSYEAGHIKPEPEIYQKVCEALNLPAEAILFTGDTKTADIDGPRALGMGVELIDSFTQRLLV
jgi:HAD superfamily hydrolase (TIGR01549 family)